MTSAGEFHDVVSCFGDPFDAYHGNSPRTNVQDGVWTSTEYPAEYDISLHNELSQASRWPRRLFFCCLVAPQTGGSTPVSDGRALLDDLDPGVRSRFESRGWPTCSPCTAGTARASRGRRRTRPTTGPLSSSC
ncbi:hypothetical protein Pflav_015320 [Phytohabitans flavus]|uniref:TauD/TfdA-like domain-containing protein n=1 Tax=Phytohabitans flavus TaxID=1076124 RepID=A0A6F8XMS4_9ACTN|nr:TauD/TfdA family dioxygenase [Phytohabitans flavus]BCB75122.1 hypothetical protein Pflav_015320 [Phytohabitans flavus]